MWAVYRVYIGVAKESYLNDGESNEKERNMTLQLVGAQNERSTNIMVLGSVYNYSMGYLKKA